MKNEVLNIKNDSWLMSCPTCSAINNNLAGSCHNCNYRFSPNLDPMGIARSEGEMLGKSLTTKPKFALLIGTWILFLPIFITGLALAVRQVLFERGTNGFFVFWFGIIGCIVSIKFLYSVTKNYYTMGERNFEHDGEMIKEKR